MFIESSASPTEARKHFFSLMDQVANDHQVVIVKRRDGENVALIAESDLASLYETAHLLKSPKNAQRLFESLERSRARDQQSFEAQSTEDAIGKLRKDCSIEQEEG
jgi:antitoxin YefM